MKQFTACALAALLFAGCAHRTTLLTARVMNESREREVALRELLRAQPYDNEARARLALELVASTEPTASAEREELLRELQAAANASHWALSRGAIAATLAADCATSSSLGARLGGDHAYAWETQRLTAACAAAKPLPEQVCPEAGPGGLDKEIIASVMTDAAPAVRAAYELLLAHFEPSDVEAVVRTKMVIGPDGHVMAVDTMTNPKRTALQQVLAARLTSLRFPPPCKGGTVTVNFPWKFRVASGSTAISNEQ